MERGDPLAAARVWFAQNRPDRAEPELRRALAESPGLAEAHVLLALTLDRLERPEEALQEAERAIAAAPDGSTGHYARASALCGLDRFREASEAVDEALRLDPEDPDAWALLSRVRLAQRKWPEALKAADQGLSLDPEHVGSSNARAIALRALGRDADGRDAIARTLEREPENAATHANAGWGALEAGNREDAERHFVESLRLSPGNEAARSGLIESLKARSAVYRGFFAAMIWLSRRPTWVSWALVLGIFAVLRVSRRLAASSPELAPYAIPVAIALALVTYVSWILVPLFDASLFLHPLGRHALTRLEKTRARWVLGLLGVAIASVIVGWAADLRFAGGFAVVSALYVIPVSGSLGIEASSKRRIFVGVTAAGGAAALAGLAVGVLAPDSQAAAGISALALALAVLVVIGVSIAANVVHLREGQG